MAKNALRPKPVPTSEPTPIPTPTLNLTPPVNVSQLVVYEEGLDDYMFRTNGKRMGDWFKYQRENVEGLKDIDMQATVYASRFLDKYDYWSVNWGRYFTQLPSDGMKYLMVQARIKLIGITQEKDPRMWGPGQDHFVVQIDQEGPTFQVHKNQTGNNTYTVDTNHVIGMRIKELEDVNDMTDTVKIFDYGYYRYYNSYGEELTGDLGYIRLGEGNAWDGYLLFEVPKDTRMKDVKVLERIDGIGSVWWQLR
jgi:hypothetical protein